ncbi:hypothetical protein LM602_08070 [Candidatus Acetothermia bacterium]|jgi:hypothetical protein|nr:hypothetical protein [Candidatus Acetothermia bacterium]MCI2432486.1 hypothetical protein [Candidatus Acetothermia bacterium]MCI2436332.1 hypothetical protein [Candidatus Acetothermia bacterium]
MNKSESKSKNRKRVRSNDRPTTITEEELYKRKSGELGLEFDRYVVEHPEILAKIPDGAVICLQTQDDPEFNAWSRRLAEQVKDSDSQIVYVYVKELRPLRSRIRELDLKIQPA